MKKIKFLFIIALIIILFKTNNVKAFGIWADKTTAYIGETVAVSVDMNGLTGKFSISSSNQGILAGGQTDWYENQTTVVYFTAQSQGQAIVTVYGYNPSDSNGVNQGDISQSVTINVIERPTYNPIDVNVTYSANNYLISLEIEGQKITPDFDKETHEYNVELDYAIEKINIKAQTENSRASVMGAGEVEVKEGNNDIKLIVRAENGNEREYIIHANVKEIDPIEVEVDDKNYHIVKKESLLGELEGFEKQTIKINENEIPVLYNEITDYTLVALRDDKGNTNLFIYDSKDETFTKYNEINVNGLRINLIDPDDDNLEKDEIEINDKKIIAYKKDNSKYYLLYGKNIETGKTNWYSYDSVENTLQRYMKEAKEKKKTTNKNAIIVLSSVILLFSLFYTIISILYKKRVSR